MRKSEGKNTTLNLEVRMEDKIKVDLKEIGKGQS
jgi:hypothetical protein